MTRLIDADALKAEMQKNSYSVEFCREHNIDYSINLSVVLMTIDAAQTVDLKDIYQEGHYDGHLEGYTKAINEERPQGECGNESICPTCKLYGGEDYCQYAGNFVIGCHQCRYFYKGE